MNKNVWVIVFENGYSLIGKQFSSDKEAHSYAEKHFKNLAYNVHHKVVRLWVEKKK